MSSSSVVSTNDSSSSNEGTSAHTQAEVSHSPHGPPRQLCQCTKCVDQISQKSYMFVLNTFSDLGVIVVLPQELLHLMW
ncbi:unnamed protein product [Sphagnum troendelagicum]|uniref:Uncharacterized protein n=1 Tax=Sphagnum troendelagicum TaxID=128251 RepID=A0ABP0URK5_9BRYO